MTTIHAGLASAASGPTPAWQARATVNGFRLTRRGSTRDEAIMRLESALAPALAPRPYDHLVGIDPMSEPVRVKRNGRRTDPPGYRVPRPVRRHGANEAEAACEAWCRSTYAHVFKGGNGPIDFLCITADGRIVLVEAKNAINRDRLDEAQRALVGAGALVYKHFAEGVYEVWAYTGFAGGFIVERS